MTGCQTVKVDMYLDKTPSGTCEFGEVVWRYRSARDLLPAVLRQHPEIKRTEFIRLREGGKDVVTFIPEPRGTYYISHVIFRNPTNSVFDQSADIYERVALDGSVIPVVDTHPDYYVDKSENRAAKEQSGEQVGNFTPPEPASKPTSSLARFF